MPVPATVDIVRTDLFTPEEELAKRYPPATVAKVLRCREMHNWFISNPDASDRDFVSEVTARHNISRVTAYSDLAVIKTILPSLAKASRDFHRWRSNEMLIETFKMAKARKDTRTMERTATSYGKQNRVDIEDEQLIPYDMIVVQPFTATEDPRTLGIEPLPNLQQKISALIEKYRAESADIEDIEFEEVDLEFDSLFPPDPPSQHNNPPD